MGRFGLAVCVLAATGVVAMSLSGQTRTGPAAGKVSQEDIAARMDSDTLLKPIAGSRLDVVQVMKSRWTREPVSGFGKFAGEVRGHDAHGWWEVIAFAEEVLGEAGTAGTGGAIAAGESSRLADRWRGRTAVAFDADGEAASDESGSRPASFTEPATKLLEDLGQQEGFFHSSILRTPQTWHRWSGRDAGPQDVAELLYVPDPFAMGDPFAGSMSLRDLLGVRGQSAGGAPPGGGSDEEQVKRAILETASGLTTVNAAAGPLAGYLVPDVPFALPDFLREMPEVDIERVQISGSLIPEAVELSSLAISSADRWLHSRTTLAAARTSGSESTIEGYLLSAELSIGRVQVLTTASPVIPVGVIVRKHAGDYAGRIPLSAADDWHVPARDSLHVSLLTQFAHIDGKYLPTQAISATLRRHEDESTSASVERWAIVSSAISGDLSEDGMAFFDPEFRDGAVVTRTAAGPALPEEWRDGAPRLTADANAIEQARMNALAAADRVREHPVGVWLLPLAFILLLGVGSLSIWWLRHGPSIGKKPG